MIDTTFWFSAPCFRIILLILLVIKRRWLRSPKVLDRSLYLLIFFTLVNCLAASLNVLYIRGFIGNDRLFLEAREITKSMNAVNFFFWLLFLLKYVNIGRLPSSILLAMPEGTWSEEERQGFGVHMRSSYDMLDMLLNDLMVATRYDTHKYSVTVTDVDLAGVVTEAVNAIRVNMPSSVEVSLSSELPEKFSVKNDGRRIRQVVLNLLTNAYQHIISGTIEVHLRQVDKVAEISVTATLPSETDKAYEHKVEKSLEDHKEGLNLRLLLCIDIARLVNSEVRRDEDYDNGIRYLFEINDIIQHRSEGQKSAGSKRLEISSNSVTAKGIL